MPTMYTAPIESGEITTARDFLLRCARHIPAVQKCMERQSTHSFTPPDEFIPVSDRFGQLPAMKQRLACLLAMTPEEISAQNEAEYQKEVSAQKEFFTRQKAKAERYSEILNKIRDWTPPSVSHAELKKFAIQELNLSMPDYKVYSAEIQKPTDEEWLAVKIEACTSAIDRAEKAIEWERQEVERANKFLTELRESTAAL